MPFKNYSLTKGGRLTIGQILSPNYVAGVSGWEIRKDGSVEFNNGTFRGTISGGTLIISQGSGATFEQFKIDGSTGITTWSKYQSPTVVIRQILANGTDLIYNDPGNGNPQGKLSSSFASAGGTDGFGNTYNQGIWAYASSGSSMGMLPVGGQAQLNMTPQGAVHTTQDTIMFSGVNNPGAANESLFLTMSSGKENGERDAGWVLTSEPADASASESALLSLGGQDAMFIDRNNVSIFSSNPLKVFSESWHNMTLLNGWTVGSGGFAQYTLKPDNTVMIRLANLIPGTIADGTSIWTAPAGYQATSVMSLPLEVQYSVAPSYGSIPRLIVRTTGDLQVSFLRGTVSSINIVAIYPLD